MPTLNFIGKEKVATYNPPFHILEKKYNFGGETQNKIIHGDNLLALKSLLPEYEGKIKCIYIDPPYNTGNENWIYNDNVNSPQIKKWLGQVVGKEGEDLTRHDKWLCMMYPRLKLLKKLLAYDGAIFISIDDNEQANLKLICDEIFGSQNFIANIVWKKKTNGNNMGIIPPVHDFIVVYCKNINFLKEFSIPLSEEYLKNKYSNPDNDPRGLWTTTDLSANHKGPYFEIINPKTGEKFFPPQGRYWVFNEQEVLKRISDGRIIFGKNGNSRPVQKVFAAERNLTQKPETWFDKQGYNSDAMLTLSKLIGHKVFDFPKPVTLLEYIFKFSTEKNSIILDSFAGSGTTAHAVLNLNLADGGDRKFILVEMESYAEKITAERVRRVGGSFDFYEIGEKIFDDDGNLNENLDAEKLREYIWFTETGTKYKKISSENKFYLGEFEGTGIYFHYEKNFSTALDMKFLATIKIRAENYLIYADECLLGEDQLKKYKIIFKKIPRDIKKI